MRKTGEGRKNLSSDMVSSGDNFSLILQETLEHKLHHGVGAILRQGDQPSVLQCQSVTDLGLPTVGLR